MAMLLVPTIFTFIVYGVTYDIGWVVMGVIFSLLGSMSGICILYLWYEDRNAQREPARE